MGKMLGIQLKQCLLWAHKFIHCQLFLGSFIIMYIRYTNVQSYCVGAIAWPYVPCFKLSTCFLWYELTLCKIEGQVLS